MQFTTIGGELPTISKEDYWNSDPRFSNKLKDVTVSTNIKNEEKPKVTNWLLIAGLGFAAFFLLKK